MLYGLGDFVDSSWIQLLGSPGKLSLQTCAVDIHALAAIPYAAIPYAGITNGYRRDR
jgi:hypothetical protein